MGEGMDEHNIAFPMQERLEMTPKKYKNITKPMTQGIRMHPSTNVTDPHSMSAREAPRRSDASPDGVNCERCCGRHAADTAPPQGRSDAKGGGPEGNKRWGERRMEKIRAQSSLKSFDCCWSSPSMSRNPNPCRGVEER